MIEELIARMAALLGSLQAALSRARASGPEAYASALDQLSELSAAKVTALQAPGQVLLKLAVTGFGVRLR